MIGDTEGDQDGRTLLARQCDTVDFGIRRIDNGIPVTIEVDDKTLRRVGGPGFDGESECVDTVAGVGQTVGDQNLLPGGDRLRAGGDEII